MAHSDPGRAAAPRIRSTILAALVVGTALIGVLIHRSPAPPSPYESLADPSSSESLAAPSSISAASPIDPPLRDQQGAVGLADGGVPDGVTVFNDHFPAVAHLDPGLADALRQATTEAARDRVELFVISGWRSPEYQEQLIDEAISEYGSEDEAARWVAAADASAHVSGDAVDIGHVDAMAWLSQHGAEYGLCQIYSNEPWHYELRLEAIDGSCPPMYADPTHDPRL